MSSSNPTVPPEQLTPPRHVVHDRQNPATPSMLPSLIVQNETSNLRLRNKSKDLDMDKPELMMTPEYLNSRTPNHVKGINASVLTDSGVGFSPSSSFSTPLAHSSDRKPEILLQPHRVKSSEESLESPMDYLQRRFYLRRRRALFSSDSRRVKAEDFLPAIICCVILASAIFTFAMFKYGLDRKYSDSGDMLPSNGRHKSMEYAVNKWWEKLKSSEKPNPFEVTETDGEQLFGKRAAINFAYESRKEDPIKGDREDRGEANVGDAQKDTDKPVGAPTESQEVMKRKLRLEKLKSSGQAFTSTKIEPQKFPQETGEVDQAEAIEKNIPDTSDPQSLNSFQPSSLKESQGKVPLKGLSDEDDFRFFS